MNAGENTAALRDLDEGDHDIFARLTAGVDEHAWLEHAAALRRRGYGVFDLRVAGDGDVEIISPDCINWWQLEIDSNGHWRLC